LQTLARIINLEKHSGKIIVNPPKKAIYAGQPGMKERIGLKVVLYENK
jgi:hypothetical protein